MSWRAWCVRAVHLLVSFHVSDVEQPAGSTKHLTSWFGHDVDVSVGFLDPDVVASELSAAGLSVDGDDAARAGRGRVPQPPLLPARPPVLA